MAVYILTLMIFVVTMALSISAIYFLFQAPAEKKRMRVRLEGIQQSAIDPTGSAEGDLLRDEVFKQMPALSRALMELPVLGRLQLAMQQAAIKMRPEILLLISFAVAFFVFLILLMAYTPLLLALALGAVAGSVPLAVVAYRRSRRLSKIEEQFPESIDMLARAVRAGHAFTTGLELIAKELPEPVSGEFRITYDQQNFGLPVKDALHNLAVRVPLPDVRFFVTALQIQRESGGNLAEILDNLSAVIRERFKILRQVRVFTAQGRMTLYILMGLPPGFTLMMFALNRSYMMPLFTETSGHWALGLAASAQLIGFLIIRRIIRIKV